MRRRNVVVMAVLAAALIVGIGGAIMVCPLVEDPDVCDALPMCSTLQLRYATHCDFQCESRLVD